jgi:hypothetical protein
MSIAGLLSVSKGKPIHLGQKLAIIVAHRAGIARTIRFDSADGFMDSSPELERALEHLNTALADSPVPEFEWSRLVDVLGLELLSRLLGVSATSVRRYKASARTTPGDVADRLHLLSLLVGDLSGAYNEFGIRQWFLRKRSQLAGRAPIELLKGRWKQDQPAVRKLQDLARALLTSPAT